MLGNPGGRSPCSWTPAGSIPQACSGYRRGPSARSDGGLAARSLISGLDSTAFALAVHASSEGSPPPTQDSLPAARQALPGGIGYPQGSDERFPVSPTSFLLSQASPGAIASLHSLQCNVARSGWLQPCNDEHRLPRLCPSEKRATVELTPPLASARRKRAPHLLLKGQFP